MKNIFSVVPENFFNPLSSPNKEVYADCILSIYNAYKSELSYGVNKENIISTLTAYFDSLQTEVTFAEDASAEKDSRSKALWTVNYLRDCGWLDIESEKNYQFNVVLREYAIPFIRTMIETIKSEETEYQGLISQIHAILQNEELYAKPYEYILKNVVANTEQLISSLKKLSVSIKRHIDKQTQKLEWTEVLDLFNVYQEEIVSKSYMRLKTSENISRFRISITKNLDRLSEDTDILKKLTAGYMEIEQETDEETARERILAMINDVKSSFFNLDKIIAEIDRKHRFYITNAVSRAKFVLSSDTNQEGKINQILRYLAEDEKDIAEAKTVNLDDYFEMFPQGYVAEESIRSAVSKRTFNEIASVAEEGIISKEEREQKRLAELERAQKRIFLKKIDEYVQNLLQEHEEMQAKDLPLESHKEFLYAIYIRIYGENSRFFRIEKMNDRIRTENYEFSNFRIIRKETNI